MASAGEPVGQVEANGPTGDTIDGQTWGEATRYAPTGQRKRGGRAPPLGRTG